MSTKKGSTSNIIQAASLAPLEAYIAHLIMGKEKEFKKTTMGRWFQTPTAKIPETKGTDSTQQIADAAGAAAMATAKEKERLRLKAVAGRRSLIATSGRGILEDATTNKKKLTGE